MPTYNLHTEIRDAQGNPSSGALALKGPTITVSLSNPVDGNEEHLEALVDTGAGITAIDQSLAESLSLPIIDRRNLHGATGAGSRDVFMGEFSIDELNTRYRGPLVGVEMGTFGQKVILGRDFLAVCQMIYNGPAGTVDYQRDFV